MNKITGLLGLCARARKYSCGDTGIEHIRTNQAYLVIISKDIGANSGKKIIDKCTYYNVEYVYMDGEIMNQAIGEFNRKFIVILDEGFARKLHSCLKG